MSDQEGRESRGLKKFAGWGAAIIAFVIAKTFASGVLNDLNGSTRFKTDDQIKSAVVKSMQSDPALDLLYEALHRDFPHRYNQFLDMIVSNARDGRSGVAAKAAGFNFMKATVQENVVHLRSAPNEDLQRVARSQLAVVSALQVSSPRNCAHFSNDGFHVDDTISRDDMFVVAQLTASLLDAARAGIDHPVPVRSANLTTSDSTAFNEALERQKLSDKQMSALSSGEMAGLTEAEQCGVGLAVYKAVTELPPQAMANVTASFQTP